ncbi:hypothetical protein A6V39_03575 [Candidatus Mycoplasma haematobovis]|uniref:Uncharacterized protein n=1 Tax=Candidatus Mycoplasma haematobovis TaxID=432608 RepID=A0A1A9QDD0_9MOLU|nr:hypothetical protein [Candidatus Mycoplasma haematobovis]OAL09966.1 hypothetical protein A6V39_03575 [Candidatus Mycoplasma haematobovis]
MTLKAIRQLTNIAWIIGGVSAATAGYSYINSKKEQVFVEYNRKPLGTISTIDDIEDYEKQKGCQFLFFTKQEKATTIRQAGDDERVNRSAAPVQANVSSSPSPVVKASSASVSAPAPLPAIQPAINPNYPNIPRYNEWNNGGVLSARNYVSKNEKRREKVIKKAEEMKSRCEKGQIIYEEIEDTTITTSNRLNDAQSRPTAN